MYRLDLRVLVLDEGDTTRSLIAKCDKQASGVWFMLPEHKSRLHGARLLDKLF